MRWLEFIRAEETEREQIAKGDKILMEFDKWIKDYYNNKKERQYFAEWDEQIAINKGRREGMIEGKIEGKKEGLIEGIKEGKRDGIMTVAQNLLIEGMSIPFIEKATGLESKEIEHLMKSVEKIKS